MDSGQVDTITKLADAFKASGPFLFSILLAAGWLWTMTKAIEIFREKTNRGGLKGALLGFAVAFLVGSMVVGWRAIDWWLAAQETPFGRYATVVRVPNDITVFADATPLYQQRVQSHGTPTHSVRLAFLLKSQCEDKEPLTLQMNREGMTKPDTFPLRCDSLDAHWQTQKTFDLDVDEKGALVLKAIVAPEGSPTKADAVRKVFAVIPEALAMGPAVIPSVTQRSYQQLKSADGLKQAAATLQSARALPAAKLQALGELHASVDALKQVLPNEAWNGALDEPLYATLLDLQRHSDRQVAKNAQILLGQLPLADDLVRLGRSAAGRRQAARIVESMSDQQVGQALQSARAGGSAELVAMLNAQQAQKKRVPPIPTYTRDGDRFFVKANWNNADEKTVQCVGKAYHDHWGGASLKQQTDLARSRTTRTVYYTKDWSVEMVRMLQACGADAFYVQGSSDSPELPSKSLN